MLLRLLSKKAGLRSRVVSQPERLFGRRCAYNKSNVCIPGTRIDCRAWQFRSAPTSNGEVLVQCKATEAYGSIHCTQTTPCDSVLYVQLGPGLPDRSWKASKTQWLP
jgi:hypothetical protein